jgi:hypothetical protein
VFHFCCLQTVASLASAVAVALAEGALCSLPPTRRRQRERFLSDDALGGWCRTRACECLRGGLTPRPARLLLSGLRGSTLDTLLPWQSPGGPTVCAVRRVARRLWRGTVWHRHQSGS